MLQQDTSDGYVIATGATHSIKELIEIAFVTLSEIGMIILQLTTCITGQLMLMN